MAPVWGIISDRYGRKLMILRAMVIGTLVVGFMSLAKSVWVVLTLRICQGLFTGTITAASALIAAGTPKERLSYALGFLSSSTFIGMSFGPLVGGLSAELIGYRQTFLIGSLFLISGFFLVVIFIHEVPESRAVYNTKQKLWQSLDIRSFFIPSLAILFILYMLIRFSRMLATPYLPLFVQEMRNSIQGTSAITGIITASTGLVTAAAGLTLARLGDRFNRLKLIAIFTGIASLVAFPSFLSKQLFTFAIFYLTAFFFIGAVEPLLQSQLSANISPQKRGLLMGLITTSGSLAWSVSPMAGSAVAIYFGVQYVYLFFSISLFLNFAFCLSWIKREKEKANSAKAQE